MDNRDLAYILVKVSEEMAKRTEEIHLYMELYPNTTSPENNRHLACLCIAFNELKEKTAYFEQKLEELRISIPQDSTK